MRPPLRLIAAFALTFTALGGGLLGIPAPAVGATIAASTTCANGVDNTGGLGLICEVTIVKHDHVHGRIRDRDRSRVPWRRR